MASNRPEANQIDQHHRVAAQISGIHRERSGVVRPADARVFRRLVKSEGGSVVMDPHLLRGSSVQTNVSRVISGEGSDITLGGGGGRYNSRGSSIASENADAGPTRSEVIRGLREHMRLNNPEHYALMQRAGVYSASDTSEEHIYDDVSEVASYHPERKPDPANHTNSLKEDIVSGIKQALGIHDPAPYYKPNKINRDNGRLGAINRTPQNKTWSIAELEYYNRKGFVNYKVKDTTNKHLPTVFAPKLPTLGLERRPPTTTYNKPRMYASLERVDQGNQIPTSFLVGA